MSQYNSFERKIAYILIKFPKLKSSLKKIYQRINYIRHKKNYTFKSDHEIKKIGVSGKPSYFGYYDKSPINESKTKIVFQSVNTKTSILPDPNSAVDLVIYDLIDDSYKKVGSSFSYNWQQGCKLMWISDSSFIYNDFDANAKEYVSKIYNLETNQTRIINFPIYDCYQDKFALSLNFERLNIGRGDYSYSNKEVKIDWTNNENDGLYLVDLKSNETQLIVTLDQIINFNYKDTMKGAKHKFNHIMISPDGAKMMFMHRWFLEDGRRYDSLYTANVNGSDINLIADDDMVSHCFWHTDNSIIAYLRDKQSGDRYYKVDINSGTKKIIGEGVIDQFGDGHPHVNQNKILFDNYPDKSRMKSLYLFDLESESLQKLGEFFESFDFYAETRCDLHPRFSFDGNLIFFDSVHEGFRALYMMET